MIKYRTESVSYGVKAQITQVQVERETASSVWIKGRRFAKSTAWDTYHDTWEDAHAYLLEHAECHVRGARRKLEEANSKLGNVKGMKKP